ncbi:MAG: hypothetical protein IT198_14065, partial [Acidimicrobiia bacterium]|nr:hypothetical protein [Acidimicrobiia bacterium]
MTERASDPPPGNGSIRAPQIGSDVSADEVSVEDLLPSVMTADDLDLNEDPTLDLTPVGVAGRRQADQALRHPPRPAAGPSASSPAGKVLRTVVIGPEGGLRASMERGPAAGDPGDGGGGPPPPEPGTPPPTPPTTPPSPP